MDYQSDNEACAIFYYHGWSDIWIKCSERFPEVLGKVKLTLQLTFPTNCVPEQVSTKYCTCAINTAIVLVLTRPVETPYNLSWPTCNMLRKNLQIEARGKVRSSWNQDCVAGTQVSGSGSRYPKLVAPAPEWFGPLKTKNNFFALFVQLACYTNYVCWIGTQVSGSRSTIQIFLAPAP